MPALSDRSGRWRKGVRDGSSGRITLQLKTPWSDGTTHVIYEPLDFIAKLAALIPRPHKNLVLYHGVRAANAALRQRVVCYGRDALLAHLGLPPDPRAATRARASPNAREQFDTTI